MLSPSTPQYSLVKNVTLTSLGNAPKNGDILIFNAFLAFSRLFCGAYERNDLPYSCPLNGPKGKSIGGGIAARLGIELFSYAVGFL